MLPLALTGKRLFDVLRVRLARLQARTRALTTSQVNRISADQLVANVVTAVAVALALLVSVLSLILVRRFVDQPLGRLVSQVKAVAGGAYDHPISTSGPTEVTVLAQAVAAMRTSIVDNSEALLRARHQLTLTEERERLAADLRDMTIQQVYALGLALASTAARQPQLASALERSSIRPTRSSGNSAGSSSTSRSFRTTTGSERSCSACCWTASKCWGSRQRWSS
jgi:HAMP domain-containing protein